MNIDVRVVYLKVFLAKKKKNLSCEYKIFMSVWLKGKEPEKFVACRGNKTEKVHRKFLQYRLFSALSLHFQ